MMHYFVYLTVFCRLVWTSWGCSPVIEVTGLSDSIKEVCAGTMENKKKFNFTIITDQEDPSCANQHFSMYEINWLLYFLDSNLSFNKLNASPNDRHGKETKYPFSIPSGQTGIYGLVAEVQFNNGTADMPKMRMAVIGYFVSGCNGTYTDSGVQEQHNCESVYYALHSVNSNYNIQFCGTKKVHYGDPYCVEYENVTCESNGNEKKCEANVTYAKLTRKISEMSCDIGKEYFLDNSDIYVDRQCHAEFEICTKMKDIPYSCWDIHNKFPNATNDVYTLENEEGEKYSVFCEFFPSHIYTYIAPTDLTTINIDDLYNNRKEVMIRHQDRSGDQFEAKIEQIQEYEDRDISIQYNSNVDFNNIINTMLGPYLYIGLLPITNITQKHDTQGYSVNGNDFTFKNCDGRSNSYFALLFNAGNNSFGSKTGSNDFMRRWKDKAIAIPSNRELPDKFFSFYEIHFGGCGGFLSTPLLADVTGISIGIRYDYDLVPVLRCIKNCKPLANPNFRVKVSVDCTHCSSEIVHYDWSTGICTSVVNCSSKTQTYPDRYLSKSFNHRRGSDFVDPLFQGIFVTVEFQNGQQVELHRIYQYSPVPTVGVCEVMPTTGYTLITDFNITCVNFTVPDGFNLSYRMFSNKVDSKKKALKFYHGDKSITSGIKLQEGLSTDNNTIYIFVKVIVENGVSILVTSTVQILPLAASDDSLSAIDMVSSLILGGTNGSNQVDDLFNSGNQEAAVQLIGIMSSTINNMNETDDDSSREQKTEVRSSMVSGLGKVIVSDFEALTTLTTVLNDVTEVKSELSEQAQDDATDLYDGLADSFDAFLSSSSDETEITETATSILKGVTGILDIVTDSGSKTLNNSQSVSASDPGDMIVKEDKAAIDKVKNSTGKLLNTLNKLSGSILAQQFTDEPPTILQTDTVTISVQKVSPEKLSGVPLSPSINSKSGVVFDEVPPGLTDVGIKMIEMKINPFIWDDSARDVNSEVLTVDLNGDNGSKVTMSNLTSPLVISLNTPETTPTNAETIFYLNLTKTNGTVDYDRNKSNIIAFNFTLLPDKTVVLKLTPLSNITRFRMLITDQQQSGSLEDILNDGFIYPDESHSQTQYTNFAFFNQNVSTIIETMNTGFVYFHHNALNDRDSPTIYLELAIDINDTEVMNNLGSNDTECLDNDEVLTCVIEVPIIVETKVLSCTYWDEEDQRWSSKGCEVSPYTTTDTLKCACNHLTSFAGGVFVLPNFVDPIGDAKLFLTFFDNPLVVTTVLVVWIVYFFLVHWARRADRIDTEKVGVIYCDDNDVTHRFSYLVCVVTGWWKDAGTTANAFIYIEAFFVQIGGRDVYLALGIGWIVGPMGFIAKGTKGASPRKKLSTTARLCFQTGSEDWFLVTVEENLGDITQVTFWHDNTGTSPHWYLSQAYIQDRQTGRGWTFIYNDWLAVDRGAILQTTGTVGAVTSEQLKNKQKHNFIMKTVEGFRDGHLWVSVFSKRPQSTFTRVQRLTCALSLLLTTMLTNIMFYGIPTDEPSDQVEGVGGIGLSLSALVIGLQSSLIMFPVNLLILQLFMRVKSRLEHMKDNKRIEISKQYSFISTLVAARKIKDEIMKKSFNFELLGNKIGLNNLEGDHLDVGSNKGSTPEQNKGNTPEQVKGNTPEQNKGNTPEQVKGNTPEQNKGNTPEQVKGNTPEQNNGNTPEQTLSSTSYSTDSSKGHSVKDKRGSFLPWWFLYISWALVIAICITSSYFVMLYGLKYGYDKSIQWLVSFLTGFTQSACVVQPIKVVCISVLLALILKKTVEFEDPGPNLDLGQDEEYLYLAKDHKEIHIPYSQPLSARLMGQIRKRLKLEWLMNAAIRDIILYCIYIAVVMSIVHGQRDINNAYRSTVAIEDVLVNPGCNKLWQCFYLSKADKVETFYQYLYDVAIPSLADMAIADHDYATPGSSHFLVGPYRIRQLRVAKGTCASGMEWLFKKIDMRQPECTSGYWIGHEDNENYHLNWTVQLTEKPSQTTIWVYQSAWDLKTIPFTGKLATYSGGGYVLTMPSDSNLHEGIVRDVWNSEWIDERTRAVILECTLYNPNADIFSVVMIIFEFSNSGAVIPHHQIFTTRLFHYSTDFGIFVLVCELSFLLFNIGFTYIEYKRYKKLGRKEYFSNKWSYVELLQIALSFSVIGLFFQRLISVNSIMKDYRASDGQDFVSFYTAVSWDYILGYVMGFLVCLLTLKFIKLLEFNKRMFMLSDIVSQVKGALISFSVLAVLFSFGFAHFATIAFGAKLKGYRSFLSSLMTLLNFTLGVSDLPGLQSANRVLGPIYFFIFVLTIQICLLTIFMAIMNYGINESKMVFSRRKNRFEMLDYILSKVRLLTGTNVK